MATFVELNAEFEAEYGRPGMYGPCIYCGAAEVCCGSGSQGECHCPKCHKRDRDEGEWSGLREDDDWADVPPECDGDTEDPSISPFAHRALI